MNWIPRFYEKELGSMLKKGKVLSIYGPRRAGKTSLLDIYIKKIKGKSYLGNGDDMTLRRLLESENISAIQTMFKGYDIVAIDEAQRINNAGTAFKILVDHLPEITVIASGSSSFSLSSKIGEPLTGRQNIITLYPISVIELKNQYGPADIMEHLAERLIFGMYPEVLTAENIQLKTDYLISLRDSYLLKDILEMDNVRNSSKLFDLLTLIAYQIGQEVSYNKLSNSLGLAKLTVERYLDLLEKSFVIKKVRGFSRNLRKEVTKTARYYFLDNGVRNAVINNFNDLNIRDDIGMLWENFLFTERLKLRTYYRQYANVYFWRTYDQKEIDLIEEREGKLYGYEVKWKKEKIKPPALWLDTYPNATYECITRENFLPFIT